VLARESLHVVGLVAIAIWMSPRLAFWGLVVLPLAAWPLAALSRRFKRLAHRSQEKDSDITSRLSEIFNNMEIIKAHSSEGFESARFQRDNLEFRRINMKGVRTREMTNPLMEFLGAIAGALVIWFGGRMIIDGQLTPGEFSGFAAAMFGLYTPLKRMSYVYNQMHEAVAAADRIFDMLGREARIRSGATRLEAPIESLEFDDVRLRYEGADDDALRGVTFAVRAGETIALVGDSGGGKTSVVNLVLRLYDPSSGAVRINGADSRELDIGDLRARIGIVTQRVYVFNDTIAANVAYGAELDPARVETALRRAHAWEFVSALPDGVDTVLDEFGANLSGGQRQRLAIARAIYGDPDVLILDEATSALDNRSEAAIQAALAEVIRGRIAIVIAHRLRTVDLADRILVLGGGRVLGEGTRRELLETCPEFRRLVELDAGQPGDAEGGPSPAGEPSSG
jgi:subfamily B ATP-binding cassette protein MsbA